MDRFGVIFDWFPKTPVVHSFDNERLNERNDDPVSRDFTRCGRVVSWYDQESKRSGSPGEWIPLRHALKIGRRCRKCWPSPETSER